MNLLTWLNSMFDPKDQSYFVEAGAHDGVGDSQTLALERLGWDGICVEPSSYFAGLKRSRKCKVDSRALWSKSGLIKEFMEVTSTELSGLIDSFQPDGWKRGTRQYTVKKVSTISLHDLLNEHNAPQTIQFLALDTEGSEAEILSAYDPNKHLILTMEIEYNGIPTSREKLLGILNPL